MYCYGYNLYEFYYYDSIPYDQAKSRSRFGIDSFPNQKPVFGLQQAVIAAVEELHWPSF
jgi:hypothetical protein